MYSIKINETLKESRTLNPKLMNKNYKNMKSIDIDEKDEEKLNNKKTSFIIKKEKIIQRLQSIRNKVLPTNPSNEKKTIEEDFFKVLKINSQKKKNLPIKEGNDKLFKYTKFLNQRMSFLTGSEFLTNRFKPAGGILNNIKNNIPETKFTDNKFKSNYAFGAYKTTNRPDSSGLTFPRNTEFFNNQQLVLKNFKEISVFYPKIKRENMNKADDLDYIFNNILTK
jgi:hypothetical protein